MLVGFFFVCCFVKERRVGLRVCFVLEERSWNLLVRFG